ncbi:hypothetical protein C8R45DRAFT_939476 [Mycena sanguinolenta]|nr:hypothetical protein C8R45DRAFT_939476 [Mycena sanguinolenta]
MDLEPHSDPGIKFTAASTINTAEPTACLNDGGYGRYTGAFFPHATRFTVNRGVFTCNVASNVYDLPPQQASEFQTIRMEELRNNPYGRYTGAFFPHATGFTIGGGVFTSNVINNPNPPHSTRGHKFEERAQKHSSIWHPLLAEPRSKGECSLNDTPRKRHPNIMQLDGLATEFDEPLTVSKFPASVPDK